METKNLSSAHAAVFKESSESLEGKSQKIEGYDFNQGVCYPQLLHSMLSTGFQASNLGDAISVVNKMLDWRLADEVIGEDCKEEEEEKEPGYRQSVRCKIFLGFTSNLISSGVRETIRYLVQHKMVDVVVTTAGGIEEDIIKCLAPSYRGDFSLKGSHLRSKGLNRIGNLLVPNDNYCRFEQWITPIFDNMLHEQTDHYCSAVDMLYFHSFRDRPLIVDIVQDVRRMDVHAVHANPRKTGIIILGGGLPKHHICNANMMRNGADYAVFINTAQEFDGSDSGAQPDEAVSWGKIRDSSNTVKVHCDATIAFPLLVGETFASRKMET